MVSIKQKLTITTVILTSTTYIRYQFYGNIPIQRKSTDKFETKVEKAGDPTPPFIILLIFYIFY